MITYTSFCDSASATMLHDYIDTATATRQHLYMTGLHMSYDHIIKRPTFNSLVAHKGPGGPQVANLDAEDAEQGGMRITPCAGTLRKKAMCCTVELWLLQDSSNCFRNFVL